MERHTPRFQLVAIVLVVVGLVTLAAPEPAHAMDPQLILAMASAAGAIALIVGYLIVANGREKNKAASLEGVYACREREASGPMGCGGNASPDSIAVAAAPSAPHRPRRRPDRDRPVLRGRPGLRPDGLRRPDGHRAPLLQLLLARSRLLRPRHPGPVTPRKGSGLASRHLRSVPAGSVRRGLSRPRLERTRPAGVARRSRGAAAARGATCGPPR